MDGKCIRVHGDPDLCSIVQVTPGLVLTSAPLPARWNDMDVEGGDSIGQLSWADRNDVGLLENRGAMWNLVDNKDRVPAPALPDDAHPVWDKAVSKDDPSRDNMIIGVTNRGGATAQASIRGQQRMEHIPGSLDMLQGLCVINANDQ